MAYKVRTQIVSGTCDLTDFLRDPPHLGLVPGDQSHVAAPPAELPGKLLPDALSAPSDD